MAKIGQHVIRSLDVFMHQGCDRIQRVKEKMRMQLVAQCLQLSASQLLIQLSRTHIAFPVALVVLDQAPDHDYRPVHPEIIVEGRDDPRSEGGSTKGLGRRSGQTDQLRYSFVRRGENKIGAEVDHRSPRPGSPGEREPFCHVENRRRQPCPYPVVQQVDPQLEHGSGWEAGADPVK